jgi:hypothetical protein
MSPLQVAVAGASHASDGDGLVDGALDAGAGGVLGPPFLTGLLSAGLVEDLLLIAGAQGECAAATSGSGAFVADWAGLTGLLAELDHDRFGAPEWSRSAAARPPSPAPCPSTRSAAGPAPAAPGCVRPGGLGTRTSTEASNPGSSSSMPSAYLTSIPNRTRCAAARSVRFSANCSTVTSANCSGDQPRRPRTPNAWANSASENSSPSSSRTLIANGYGPLAAAALAARPVASGTCGHGRACIDTPHPTLRPDDGTRDRYTEPTSITTDRQRNWLPGSVTRSYRHPRLGHSD